MQLSRCFYPPVCQCGGRYISVRREQELQERVRVGGRGSSRPHLQPLQDRRELS